jgi:Flp pilus assembly pilin Flp
MKGLATSISTTFNGVGNAVTNAVALNGRVDS